MNVDPLSDTTASDLSGDRPPPSLDTVETDRYERHDLLSEGGMGRITIARDRRLGRRVAIKELRAPSASLRARFQRETLLTARLEHPSIVSLHEAGLWPSGEPFYAMRLVAGQSLDKAIKEAGTPAERIALVPHVLAVADAMAYAHSKRIVHRDLKPHNVMIGEFGETVVIDWGLAKDLDRDRVETAETLGGASASESPAETAYGAVLGTPAYMPPEQARGASVDERADVFAIGALLYHALAGEPPYTGRSSEAVLEAVLRGPPQSLAERQPGLPDDLVAIVERAMAREPEERYRDGRALAEDLRRFQTGQLVGTHRYSAAERVRRWVRRHKGAVGVAAIAIAVMLVAGVLAIARIMEARRAAEHQRGIAESHRADAEDLIGFMLVDLRKQLQSVERLDLLEPVAKKAVSYYDRADQPPSTGAAAAHEQLGDVLHLAGDDDAALAHYRRALAVLGAISTLDPRNLEARRKVAVMHNRIGAVQVAHSDTIGALAEHRAALATAAALAAAAPDSVQAARDVAFTRRAIGNILLLIGDGDGALAADRAALEAISAHAALHADDAELLRDVEISHNQIADALADRDATSAIAELEVARAIAERLASADASLARQRDLEVVHQKLGQIRYHLDDDVAALADFRAELAIAERLAAHDPDNAVWQRDVALAKSAVADVLRDQRDLDGAAALYGEALAVREALAARDPDNARWQLDLANNHERLAALEVSRNHADAAERGFRAALALRERLAALDPADMDLQRAIGTDHTRLSLILEMQRDPDGALAEARLGVGIAERMVARDPSNERWKQDRELAQQQLDSLVSQRAGR